MTRVWSALVRACSVGLAMVVLSAGSIPSAYGQRASIPRLEVWMMTFGGGEEVFLKFGHNAILVRGRDPNGNVLFERVYDYGLFDGTSPTLVADFLQGRMQYWVAVTTLDRTMRRYRRTNRDVAVQKLRLTQDQALDLFRRLERNIKPENRYYRYDYYYDNCSTRVRDVLDEVTGGAVKQAFTGTASMTLRDHSLRHTADDWKYYLGLDLGLANVDDPIDLWIESFLPQKLREALRKVRVDVDGKTVPLVEKEEVWFDGTRPEVPARPPARGLLLAVIGLTIGGLLAGLGWIGQQSLAARRTFVSLAVVVSCVLSLFGILLIYLWTSTDHSIAYGNENIFNLAPFGVLAPLAALVSRRPGQRALFRLFAAAAVFSVVGVLLKVLPGFDQETYRLVGLLLPTWSGLALGAWFICRRPR